MVTTAGQRHLRQSWRKPNGTSGNAVVTDGNLPEDHAAFRRSGVFRPMGMTSASRAGPFLRSRRFFYRVLYRIAWDSRRRLVTQQFQGDLRVRQTGRTVERPALHRHETWSPV